MNNDRHNQILLATHDPLVVLNLSKGRVRLFNVDERTKRVSLSEPSQSLATCPCPLVACIQLGELNTRPQLAQR